MKQSVNYPRIKFEMISALREETGDTPFRISGAEPFFFQNVDHETRIMFRSSRGPQKIARIYTSEGTINLHFEDGVSAFVSQHVARIAPAIGDALIAVSAIRRTRQHDLKRDAFTIVGPKESNKKVGTLTVPAAHFLKTAVFGNLISATLPQPLKITGVDVTSRGCFDWTIAAADDKGVEAHVLTLRHANGRIDTTSQFEDQKARPEFFNFLYDTMKTQRDRFLADPDLHENLKAARDGADDLAQLIMKKNSKHTPFASYYFKAGDEQRIVNKDAFGTRDAHTDAVRTEVKMTDEISVLIRTSMGSSSVFAVTFRDQPIMTEWAGGMPGIPEPDVLWSIARAIAIKARPDLLTRDARQYDIMMAMPPKVDLDTELQAALTHADAHTPALEI